MLNKSLFKVENVNDFFLVHKQALNLNLNSLFNVFRALHGLVWTTYIGPRVKDTITCL